MSLVSGVEDRLLRTRIQELDMFHFWIHAESSTCRLLDVEHFTRRAVHVDDVDSVSAQPCRKPSQSSVQYVYTYISISVTWTTRVITVFSLIHLCAY